MRKKKTYPAIPGEDSVMPDTPVSDDHEALKKCPFCRNRFSKFIRMDFLPYVDARQKDSFFPVDVCDNCYNAYFKAFAEENERIGERFRITGVISFQGVGTLTGIELKDADDESRLDEKIVSAFSASDLFSSVKHKAFRGFSNAVLFYSEHGSILCCEWDDPMTDPWCPAASFSFYSSELTDELREDILQAFEAYSGKELTMEMRVVQDTYHYLYLSEKKHG